MAGKHIAIYLQVTTRQQTHKAQEYELAAQVTSVLERRQCF